MESRVSGGERERLIDQIVLRTLERIQETYIGLNRDPSQIVDLLLVIQPHLRGLVRDVIDNEIAFVAVQRIEEPFKSIPVEPTIRPSKDAHIREGDQIRVCIRADHASM